VAKLEASVCAFLGVATLGDEPRIPVRLRHSGTVADRAAQRAWVRRAETILLEGPPTAGFSARTLERGIPSLLTLARAADESARVPEALRDLGVRFAVVPQLPGSKLDGAAMFTSAGPAVALTLRFDRIDSFWFTLLHELAHLACGHRAGHLDGDATEIDDEEREANDVASRWLLDESAVRGFVRDQRGRITASAIDRFAGERGLHPGIVVGRLQHLEAIGFHQFRAKLVRVREWLGA
jgi:HTH-type transcriptional regulator/antitoxin HigA